MTEIVQVENYSMNLQGLDDTYVGITEFRKIARLFSHPAPGEEFPQSNLKVKFFFLTYRCTNT